MKLNARNVESVHDHFQLMMIAGLYHSTIPQLRNSCLLKIIHLEDDVSLRLRCSDYDAKCNTALYYAIYAINFLCDEIQLLVNSKSFDILIF